jgi:hypothetical protein
MSTTDRDTKRNERRSAHRAHHRAAHAELADLPLLDDATVRLGNAGYALYEYFTRLDALREAAEDIGRTALTERAARAELHMRLVLSAGLDAINELQDLGLIRESLRAAIKKPETINEMTLQEAVRHASLVLKRRYPSHQWDWLDAGSELLSQVGVRVKPAEDGLRAVITRNGHPTTVWLNAADGLRTDIRAFFSDGPERVFATASMLATPPAEPTAPIEASSAYDSAVIGLALAREWVYRHARNTAEGGAPARSGAGPAAVVLVLLVVAVFVEIVAAIEFAVCKLDNDPDACKWSAILSTLGLILLAGGKEAGGVKRSDGGNDPSLQFGTNRL